jgi:hypothetical protein
VKPPTVTETAVEHPTETGGDGFGNTVPAAPTNEHQPFSAVTMLVNHPVTFTYDGTQTYEPGNYHDEYEKYGDPVSVRVAWNTR